MEGNGLTGRLYSNTGVGMLGLEIPLHQPTEPQNPQHLQKHQQMMAFAHQQQQQQQQQQHHEHQTQLSMKQPTNYLPYNHQNSNPNPNPNQNPCHKPKTQMTQLTNSDEDEPGCAYDHENSSMEGKRKGSNNMSPWQRMKWTDNMVRLLIMAVYYIGDEAGNEIGSEKKKSGSGGATAGAGGGGGLLQKKGKWKSVSRAMMEKGFYVSPQQCEDKFNDLNKRYKRVNDILGKGTACRVVENQSLLDSMDLSPKMKEEVRKLLNSKHLFFREMCAYHNSCGHGTGGSTSEAATPASMAEAQHIPQHHPHQQLHQQQSYPHSAAIPTSSIEPNDPHEVGLGSEDHEDEEDDDDDDDEEDELDDEEEEHEEGGRPRKRGRTPAGSLQAWQQLSGEVMGILQDGSKSSLEKKQWMKTQLMQLEEQGLKIQFEALNLEKQRLKWIRFSSKKEREMEKMKIDNERKRLENERMLLLLKQKEIELLVEPQPQQHPSNPSCVTA